LWNQIDSQIAADIKFMTICQKCNAILIADGLPQGQQVRCVKCANLFRLGEEKKTSADRLAWRSFWLGLSSLVFIFFTGLPAIYYGIRSLLRMRFTKPRPKDRFAAVAGTMMGGCFGLCGAFVAAFAAIIAITLSTVDSASTEQEKAQHFSRVFENEMPPELLIEKAVSVLNSQHFFDLVDHEEPEQRAVRVHLLHHNSNFQPLRSQVVMQLRGRIMKIPNHELVEKSSERLTWKMLDQDIEVRKVIYAIHPNEDEEEENAQTETESSGDANSADGTAIQYYGICKSPYGYTGMSVTTKQPQAVFTEEKIRELFAALKPIN
jgi:hypothetical protein